MKTTAKKNKNDKPGSGHKARIAVEFKATLKMPGVEETQVFEGSYDVTVTVEHLDYLVRNVAGSIARVASNIAAGGPSAEAVAGDATPAVVRG